MSDGDIHAGGRLAEESLVTFRGEGDEAGLAWAHVFLAWARYSQGDMAGGSGHMRQALDANRAAGIAAVTVNAELGLAYEALLTGNVGATRAHLADALDALEKAKGDLEEIAWLWVAAGLAARAERFVPALRLAGAADTRARRYGGNSNEAFVAPILRLVARADGPVRSTARERLRAEGASMAWDELVAEALVDPEAVEDPLTPPPARDRRARRRRALQRRDRRTAVHLSADRRVAPRAREAAARAREPQPGDGLGAPRGDRGIRR